MTDSRLVEDFARDGVVLVRGLLDSDALEELRDALARYEAGVRALPPGDYTLEPDGKSVRNLWRMQLHSRFFREWMARPRFIELVRPLLGGDVEPLGVESFSKPARVGSGVPPHQDNAYFCLSPPAALTLWIAVDPVTVANGAVEYFLGSHHALRSHSPSGVKGNSYALSAPPEPGDFVRFQPELRPGDALLHHALVIHASPPNQSDASRRAVVIVYRARNVVVDPVLHERYLEALSITPQDA